MPRQSPPDSPTLHLWRNYQSAFDYFNATLFDGRLPPCILNFSARGKSSGWFTKDRWRKGEQTSTHEISLNPDLLQQPVATVMSTLVRLMVSLWQHTDPSGTPSRAGYYNSQWATRMEAIGLMPSHTGEPGGLKVGEGIRHYIVPEGKFAQAMQEMPKDYFPWQGESPALARKRPTRIKYVCPVCGDSVLARPGGLQWKCFTDNCDAFVQPETSEG